MGCRLKTTIPCTAALLKPQQQYDRHCSRELPSLQTGDVVRMQHGRELMEGCNIAVETQLTKVLHCSDTRRNQVPQKKEALTFQQGSSYYGIRRLSSLSFVTISQFRLMNSLSSTVTNTSESNNNMVPQAKTMEEACSNPAAPLEPSIMTTPEPVVVKTPLVRTVKPSTELSQ